jgi:hypothetical protein
MTVSPAPPDAAVAKASLLAKMFSVVGTVRLAIRRGWVVVPSMLITAFYLIIVVGLLVGNYCWASRGRRSSDRLRWYLQTRRAVVPNELVRDDDFYPRLGWLSGTDGDDLLPGGSAVAGQYMVNLLVPGQPVRHRDLQQLPECLARPQIEIVPVRVRSPAVLVIKPQMTIALAATEDGTVPTTTEKLGGPFIVVAVLPPNGETTTVFISLPSSAERSLLSSLVAKLWVPVILPAK